MERVKKIIRYFYDIRAGEWVLSLQLFVLHYLLMVSLYLLKPTRDSLFLTEWGASSLPFLYVFIAVVAVPVTLIFTSFIQRYQTDRSFKWTALFLMGSLAVIRVLFLYQFKWISVLFYIWVSLFGILIVSQFWLIANERFNAAQSKRIFGLLNLGAIIGAISGSKLSNVTVETLNLTTENLLWGAVITLSACYLIVWSIYRSEAKGGVISEFLEREERDFWSESRRVFDTLLSHRYQILISLVIGSTMIGSTFVDYQFKTLATQAFPEKDTLTSFLGNFYGGLSLISLFIQFFLARKLLQWFGIGGAIFSRPLGVLFGAVLLAIEPVLIAAVFLRGYDGGLRYSMDKTGREMLFLPLSQKVKKRTKIFIDLFVNRFFRGIGGILLLILVFALNFNVQQIAYVLIGILGLWIYFSYQVRKEYVNEFRQSLLKRSISPAAMEFDLTDRSIQSTVMHTLKHGNPSQIIYILNLLEGLNVKPVASRLIPLLQHEESEIRYKTLLLLQHQKDVHYPEEVRHLVKDPDPRIRFETIFYFCEHSGESPDKVLGEFLQQSDVKLQSAAFACIGVHGGSTDYYDLDESFIKKLKDYEGEDKEIVRAQVAQALGRLNIKNADYHLLEMGRDEEPMVVREVIKSMSKRGSTRFLPYLMKLLSSDQYNIEARTALARFDVECIPYFCEHFWDETEQLETRKHIPAILASMPCKRAVHHLTQMLQIEHPQLRYHVIKSLNKLNKKYLDINIPKDAIIKAIEMESRAYYTFLAIKDVQPRKEYAPRALLYRALDEKMNHTLERIFRLSGLVHSQLDMYGAYLGLTSQQDDIQSGAIEFLDNVLQEPVKTWLFPIIDTLEIEEKVNRGKTFFDISVDSYQEGLLTLLDGEDEWLKGCAIYSVSDQCPSELRKRVVKFTEHANPFLRETARLTVQRFDVISNK